MSGATGPLYWAHHAARRTTARDRFEDRAADFIRRFDRPAPKVAATVAHLTQDRELKAYLSLLDDLFARQRSGQLERDDR